MTAALAQWALLDWTFLLPVPLPAAVRCADPVLAPLLRDLAGCTLVAEGVPAQLHVAVDPSRSDLRAAVAGLAPGGVLYAQVSLRSGTVARRARDLERLGLQGVTGHWHPPTPGNRTRMVPLHDPAAVLETLSRSQALRFGRQQAALARALHRAGLLGLVVPGGSVLGLAPS